MDLSEVVPWGRTLREYREMFSLSSDVLGKRILGCADGPACFNAELTADGGSVVSVDPIYAFSPEQIRGKIQELYPVIMEQVARKKGDYVWKNIRNIEQLGKQRMDAMQRFLEDYEKPEHSSRYLAASLPDLPFADGAFDLALCSHYLFLYSDHVGLAQHILSMKELCRVAAEVRVYPILSITDNRPSFHLKPVRKALEEAGIDVSLVPVGYEFQKGATEMLVARVI